MLDLDSFIVSVYCLVVDRYQEIVANRRLRRAGFLPQLTDAEVITIEIVGEYLGLETDKAIFEYFTQHYQPFQRPKIAPSLSDKRLTSGGLKN